MIRHRFAILVSLLALLTGSAIALQPADQPAEAPAEDPGALPSLDELRGKLVGLVQAPASKIARTVTAPAGQLARVFGAFGAKDAA